MALPLQSANVTDTAMNSITITAKLLRKPDLRSAALLRTGNLSKQWKLPADLFIWEFSITPNSKADQTRHIHYLKDLLVQHLNGQPKAELYKTQNVQQPLLIKVPGVRIPDGSPIERPVKPHEYAICGFFAYIKYFYFLLKSNVKSSKIDLKTPKCIPLCIPLFEWIFLLWRFCDEKMCEFAH